MKLQEICPVTLEDSRLTEEVIVSVGALASVREMAEKHLGKECILLADPDTLSACEGIDLPFKKMILDPHPQADTETIEQIVNQIPDRHRIIALGAGTINDLAKKASDTLKRPYIAVGTAASMNGYASGIAAILDNGLKTTVDASPPRAIILDTEILSRAPRKLTQAGLGDLISKPVSDTDWWLAGQLGEASYSPIPGQIVEHAMEKATANPVALREGDAATHGELGKALVLSGVAMVVAGSSSPASGGEHLISHLWDMENLVNHSPKQLHGAQVGLTTCISAAIYEMVCQIDEPKWITVKVPSEERRRLLNDHPQLVNVITNQAMAKHQNEDKRIAYLKQNWTAIREGLKSRQIPNAATFKAILEACGAPSHFREFNLTRQYVRRTLSIARDIRNRFTILDLAHAVGILPDKAETVLTRAGF